MNRPTRPTDAEKNLAESLDEYQDDVNDLNEIFDYADDLETYANELEARLCESKFETRLAEMEAAEKPAEANVEASADISALRLHVAQLTSELAQAQAKLYSIGVLAR